MTISKKAETSPEISVLAIKTGQVFFHIIGITPLIYNCMSFKAKGDLLFPKGKMSTADKASNLKHDPIKEYRASVYRRRDNENGPTRLIFPACAFKKASSSVAKDLPGSASTAKISRLTWVNGNNVDIYGAPQMLMSVVRMADINHTPDIRTRAILPEWCAKFSISYNEPMLTAQTVSTLVAASGILNGIGDWRQEKGSANYGQFRQCEPNDPDYLRIMQSGGMEVQDEALNQESPVCYDLETEELFAWYMEERMRRGREPVKVPKTSKKANVEETSTVN